MKNEFGLTTEIQWDRKADRTHVYVKFSAPRVFRKPTDWEKYVVECRESLHRVAAGESIEILVWSIDLDWEDDVALITHHVYARGLLPGATPNRIARALRPARGYATLDLLAGAVVNDLRIDSLLKRAVQANCLQRHDRDWKPLPDPLPTHLLARALTESNWRGLISPSDKPWAYINTTTQHIYQRSYADGTGSANPLEDTGLSPAQIDKRVQIITGDELVIENIPEVLRNCGCSADVICVLMARYDGKKWNELPKYLTGLTGTHWDRRRVEAARASIGRQKDKLHASGRAASEWKPRLSNATSYKQRLSKGGPGNGLWTHSLRGANVDIYREVMAAERKKLFVTK